MSDLSQSGPTLILGLVNDANPSLPNGALSNTNVTLGTPGTGTTKNTALAINAVAGQGYTGNVTVNYNRLAIDTDVFSVLAPSGATLVDASTPYATIADLLAPINTKYNLDLQASDISNGATAISGAYPKTAVLQIAAGSLVYTSSLSVQITQPQVDLATAVTNTDLNGLTPPPAPG